MNPKKRSGKGTFGLAPGVFISNQLRTSAAYMLLTPIERLVLIDMIGRYNRKSRGDKENRRFRDLRENTYCEIRG
jgi:hypothetical protein